MVSDQHPRVAQEQLKNSTSSFGLDPATIRDIRTERFFKAFDVWIRLHWVADSFKGKPKRLSLELRPSELPIYIRREGVEGYDADRSM